MCSRVFVELVVMFANYMTKCYLVVKMGVVIFVKHFCKRGQVGPWLHSIPHHMCSGCCCRQVMKSFTGFPSKQIRYTDTNSGNLQGIYFVSILQTDRTMLLINYTKHYHIHIKHSNNVSMDIMINTHTHTHSNNVSMEISTHTHIQIHRLTHSNTCAQCWRLDRCLY